MVNQQKSIAVLLSFLFRTNSVSRQEALATYSAASDGANLAAETASF